MEEFTGNIDLIKANDNSPTFICTQCGECCHIREEKKLSEDEETSYLNYMFKSFGIIYLADLKDITINIWPEEKDRLLEIAKQKGIVIDIKPKRAIYNALNNELIILDYFINSDICPFFDESHKNCTIHDDRPLICKSYPLTTTKSYGKCRYKKKDLNAYSSELIDAKELEDRITKQKQIIKDMITQGKITIPKTISELEMLNILHNAKIIELRIK